MASVGRSVQLQVLGDGMGEGPVGKAEVSAGSTPRTPARRLSASAGRRRRSAPPPRAWGGPWRSALQVLL